MITTKKQNGTARKRRSSLAPCSGPSAEEIAHAREFVLKTGAKLRAGGKMTINTTTMTTRVWPTIEIWDAKRRQYLPVQVGTTWRYDTSEERDRVLTALLAPNTRGEPTAPQPSSET